MCDGVIVCAIKHILLVLLTRDTGEVVLSVRIMSPASLHTSVPTRPMAMPMSVHFRVTALFMLSPVIPTTWPSRCNVYNKTTPTRSTTPEPHPPGQQHQNHTHQVNSTRTTPTRSTTHKLHPPGQPYQKTTTPTRYTVLEKN